ncbi:hypothetical protein QFZ83_003668 [Variovorax sp. W1I1]|nr:hypothetical protein [Variovorax sp. W1I1]
MQRFASDRRVESRIGSEGDPACQLHYGKQGMELVSALGGSLILVAGSVWWIFRK